MEEGLLFKLGTIRAQDNDGNNLGYSLSPGQQIVLTFDATNDGNSAQFYVALLQISSEDGTAFLASDTGTAAAGYSIVLDFTWQAEEVGTYTVKAFLWTSLDGPTALSEPSDIIITTSLDGPTALSEPSDTETITINVLTPLQESLQESIEELKREGKPYPKVTYETESKVPTPSEITESLEADGSFVTNVTAKTVIEYAGPEEAGKERWDDIVIESQEPPTATVDNNNTETLLSGNLTQLIIDEHPEIYGDGNGTYQYGEEPRTFVVEESIAITFVESEDTSAQVLDVPIPRTQTESSNTVMGFSVVPKRIDYTVNPKVTVGYCPFCATIAEARAGFLFDMAFGLRLPVQVDITRPESMVAGREYVLDTSITPVNFSAEDYERMGLPAEDGNEFFARFEFFLGLKAWFLGELVVDKAIDSHVDLGDQCSQEMRLDCQDFVTPFGSDENGINREFPIRNITLSPDDTGLEYTESGIVSVGLGLRIDPDIGSDKISAKWSAAGDASGNGEVVYSAAYPSKYPIGPILAVGNSDNSGNPTDQGQGNSAVITLDNYKFYLNRQIIAILGNVQVELFGHDVYQTKYVKLVELDFTKSFGEPVLGQHHGVGGILSTIPVIADEETVSEAEQIKNDMMLISGVVGVSVDDAKVSVMLQDIESTILVPTQLGERKVFRDVSGPVCTLLANDTNSCQDAWEELRNDEFVKVQLLNIVGVSSVSFEGETIVVFIENDEARKAIPDTIAGKTLRVENESKADPIERTDVTECLELFSGAASKPYSADGSITIDALQSNYEVEFDYRMAFGDDADVYEANAAVSDPANAKFLEKEAISMVLHTNDDISGDVVTLYHQDVSDCDILFKPLDIPSAKKIVLETLSVTEVEPFSGNYLVEVAIPDKSDVSDEFGKLVVGYDDNDESGVLYIVPDVEVVASESEVRECFGSFNDGMIAPTVANEVVSITALQGSYEVDADYSRIEDDSDNRGFAYYVNPEARDPEDAIFIEDETITFLIRSNGGGSSTDSEDVVTFYTSDVSDCDILFQADSIPSSKKLQLGSTDVTDLGNGEYLHEVVIPEKSIVGDSFTKLVISYKDETESRVYYSLPNIKIIKSDSSEDPLEAFNISGHGSGLVECTNNSFIGTIAIDAAQGPDGTMSGTITITDPDTPATTVAQIDDGSISNHEFTLISNNPSSIEGPFCHSGDDPDTIQVMGINGEGVEISFDSICIDEGGDDVECVSSKGVFVGDVSITSGTESSPPPEQ